MRKLLFILFFLSFRASSQIVYVNHAATGANNGTSWTDAYVSLAEAINNTNSGEIWVAKGTYKPTGGTNRNDHFTLKNNLGIYGGFSGNGTESVRIQRDYTANETIMSGDIGMPLDTSDNSYHVIFIDASSGSINSSAVLDGFKVQDGNATNNTGGGIALHNNANPTISNCIFTNNFANIGAGCYVFVSDPKFNNVQFVNNSANFAGGGIGILGFSSVQVNNCIFTANSAAQIGGGAIWSATAGIQDSTQITNTSFINNTTSIGDGGAIYNSGIVNITHSILQDNEATNSLMASGGAIFNFKKISLSNCLLVGNKAQRWGGAILSSNSQGNNSELKMTNCTLVSNRIDVVDQSKLTELSSGGISVSGSTVEIHNTILYFNRTGRFIFTENNYRETNGAVSTIRNCIGEDLPPETNLMVNPQFVNISGDFNLKPNSPAINRGDNSKIAALTLTDINRNPRIIDCTVDIGAYEYQLELSNAVHSLTETGCRPLRGMISIASSGDTIRFSNTLNGDSIELTLGQILIDKDLVIIGNGKDQTIIDGHGLNRIFEVQPGKTLTLKKLTLQNGGNVTEGGAIKNLGTLILDSVAVNYNKVLSATDALGGGIYNADTLSISNSCFIGNETECTTTSTRRDSNGGAIYNVNHMEIENSIFYSNKTISTSEAGGGAIANRGSSNAYCLINRCDFRGNEAFSTGALIFSRVRGGAILNRDINNTAKIFNSTFSGNTAHATTAFQVTGGAIANVDDNTELELINCTVAGNHAAINSSAAGGSAGGVYQLRGMVTLVNSIIAQNTATGTVKDLATSNGTLNSTDTHIFDPNGHAITLGNGLNPHFMTSPNPAPSLTGDLRLKPCSHLINAGTGDDASALASMLDLAGNPRVFESKVDVGAYEHQNYLLEETNADITTGPGLYSADGFFESSHKITSPQLIEFQAGRAVILKQGFEAEVGSVFRAQIVSACL